jgi:hypothetical protein
LIVSCQCCSNAEQDKIIGDVYAEFIYDYDVYGEEYIKIQKNLKKVTAWCEII